jgi:hypothetical protein
VIVDYEDDFVQPAREELKKQRKEKRAQEKEGREG